MIELPVIFLCVASFFGIVVQGCDRALEREGLSPWREICKLMACWLLATLATALYWQGIIYLMVEGQAHAFVRWKHQLHFSLIPMLWLSYRCFKGLLLRAPKRKGAQGQQE
ncbi:MAG TPA: hypothetical protein VGE39_07095 [Prosthecobacter sp.]